MLQCSKAHVLYMKRQPQRHKVYVTRVSNAVKHKKLKNLREHITEKILLDIARITLYPDGDHKAFSRYFVPEFSLRFAFKTCEQIFQINIAKDAKVLRVKVKEMIPLLRPAPGLAKC